MSVEKDVYSYLIYNHNVFSRLFHVYRFSGALIPRAAFVKGLRAALCVVIQSGLLVILPLSAQQPKRPTPKNPGFSSAIVVGV